MKTKLERINQLELASKDIIRRGQSYEYINLVGKTPGAKRAGTIRNMILIAQQVLRNK